MLIPDYMYDRVTDIPLDEYVKKGKKLFILDIDNTLVTYDDPLPTRENMEWFKKLDDAGINVVFISNNHEMRVRPFAEYCGKLFYFDASKPFVKYHRLAMQKLGVKPDECVCIGDQIFTDVLASHLAGIEAVLVNTIKDPDGWFIKLIRLLEKPFVRCYIKKHGGK